MNWTAMSSTGIPFARLAFAGTFLLGSVGALIGMSPKATTHASYYQLVLKLDGHDSRREYRGSQWDNAPVVLDHDASDGRRVTFTHRWPMVDGCWWESTETLDPISATQYRYHYNDAQVSCPNDDDAHVDAEGTEWVPWPRTGTVDVVPLK